MHENNFLDEFFRENAENFGRVEWIYWQYFRKASWLWQPTEGLGKNSHKIKKEKKRRKMKAVLMAFCSVPDVLQTLEEAFG